VGSNSAAILGIFRRVSQPVSLTVKCKRKKYFNNMYYHQLVNKIKTKYIENFIRVPVCFCALVQHLEGNTLNIQKCTSPVIKIVKTTLHDAYIFCLNCVPAGGNTYCCNEYVHVMDNFKLEKIFIYTKIFKKK
jgi:hypothetical protein